MTRHDKLCQMFMVLSYGSSANEASPEQRRANQAYLGVPTVADLLATCPVGGFVYLARNTLDPEFGSVETGNFQDPATTARLSASLQDASANGPTRAGVLIAADQEEGLVTRMREPFTTFSGNMSLGADPDPDSTRTAASVVGAEIRSVGINTDLAPVADVNVNPSNPVIGVRSFGADPSAVASRTSEAIAGFHASGVAATTKHFPGHGDTSVDSHFGLPVIGHDEATLVSTDLPPFQSAIDAGTDLVMTAHISVPALDPSGLPATLSKPILTGLLRDRLHFGGVVVTDSLWMAGVRAGHSDDNIVLGTVEAGTDLLLTPPSLPRAVAALDRAVTTGRIPEARIDESVRHILRVKAGLGLLSGTTGKPMIPVTLGSPESTSLATRLAARGSVLLAPECSTPPLPVDESVTVLAPSTSIGSAMAGELVGSGYRATAAALGNDASQVPSRASAVIIVTDATSARLAATAVRRIRSENGVALVAVLGSPYDAGSIPTSSGTLLLFDTGKQALAAAAAVFSATASAEGRLPVALPDRGGGRSYEIGTPSVRCG